MIYNLFTIGTYIYIYPLRLFGKCYCHHGDGPSKIANQVLKAILLIFGGSIEIWYELSFQAFRFYFSYIFKVYSALEIDNWQPKRVEGFLYSLHNSPYTSTLLSGISPFMDCWRVNSILNKHWAFFFCETYWLGSSAMDFTQLGHQKCFGTK